jgi:Tfp pilus assembly protein PilO
MAQGNTGDWTAGLLIIAAAVLIGAGIPLGLWLGLYQPKVAEHAAKRAILEQLNTQLEELFGRKEVVSRIQRDVEHMSERLTELEQREVPEDERHQNELMRAAALLNRLADTHNLEVPVERFAPGMEVVRPGPGRVSWPHGLRASQLEIHASGTFHDFARFVQDMESRRELLVIPDSMSMIGDVTGTRRIHTFTMRIYVIEARDIEAIGQQTQERTSSPSS